MRGNRLREIREQRQLSQRELAARCGIGEKQIWRYENGDSEPTTGQFVKIVSELGVSADYLLGLIDEPRGHYQGEVQSAFEQNLLASVRKNDTVALIGIIHDISDLLLEKQQELRRYEKLALSIKEAKKRRAEKREQGGTRFAVDDLLKDWASLNDPKHTSEDVAR